MMSTDRQFHVLFVDDEPKVLGGLRRTLYPERNRWVARFASGAAEATALMRAEQIDVIVTDMRMPGEDGVELLEIVAKGHPGTTRLVLSGQSDSERSLRAARIAHQFLAKPIATQQLLGTIARLARLHARLRDDRLRHIAAAPTLPGISSVVLAELCDLLSRSATAPTVARCIERDPVLTAKLLQLVNSGFFAPAFTTTSIDDAIRVVGTDILRRLVGTREIESAAALSATNPLIQRELIVAATAARIARRISAPVLAADAGVVALLDGIERILVLQHPEAALSTDRALSGYLLDLWGLPEHLVDAVSRDPDGNSNTLPAQLGSLAFTARQLAEGNVPRGAESFAGIADEERAADGEGAA